MPKAPLTLATEYDPVVHAEGSKVFGSINTVISP